MRIMTENHEIKVRVEAKPAFHNLGNLDINFNLTKISKTKNQKDLNMEILEIDECTIKTVGSITNFSHTGAIKQAITKLYLKENDKLNLLVHDTETLPSALMGYLMYLSRSEKMDIHISFNRQRLYDQFIDLKLDEHFHIRLEK